MSFSSPAFLWILAALAPLVAIYFLKIRPRRLPVNAFFLWNQIFEERRASSLFQRLRDLISLLLLALVIAALAIAAAGPRFSQDDKRDLLIVIDVSPSMRAKVGGRETIQQAKNRAREIIRALNGTRRAALATSSGELRFLCHLSSAPKDLLDALARVEVSDMPVTSAAIRSLNAFSASSGSGHRVLLLTDGHGGWEGLSPGIEVIRLGGTAPNAGLVAADITWAESGGRNARFYYRIVSTFPKETYAELELRNEDGGGLARLVPVVLRPGEEASATLDVENASAGRWTAILKIEDALATDNQVSLGLAERRPVAIRLDTRDAYFFGRCVDAFAQTGGLLTRVESGGDIAIAQGTTPADGKLLIFAPDGESPFWKSVGEPLEILAVESKVKDHPLVRSLDLDALRFEGARKIEPAAGSLILANSESGVPLIWKSQVGNRTAVVVNLDPTRGDFFLSPWFPALVHGAAVHLADRENPMLAVYPTGTRLSIPGKFSDTKEKVTRDGLLIERRGIYQMEHAGMNIPFGGALLEPAETRLDGGGPLANARAVAQGQPVSFWLIVVAILVLTAESLLYHRRKAG
ncbi:MAG: BatA and WFA domain-containing protein [Verrucomicrobiota bacterium]